MQNKKLNLTGLQVLTIAIMIVVIAQLSVLANKQNSAGA